MPTINRQQRRKAATTESKPGAPNIPAGSFFPTGQEKARASAAKPSLLVRGFAAIVLSAWVRRRVKHPAARSALALIAREVGRVDVAIELEN